MQSKSDLNIRILSPAWQTAGVILTALVLGIILFFFQKKFDGNIHYELLYPTLLTLSVVVFYCADHLYDELKIRRSEVNKKRSIRINILLSSVAFIGIIILIINYANEINFLNLLFPFILTVSYFLLLVITGISLRWTKEIIIALVVSYALLYPFWSAQRIAEILPVFASLFCICFQNLVIFGVFEKQKDEYYGFSTAFSGQQLKDPGRAALWILTAISLILVFLFFSGAEKLPGVFFCAAVYGVMILFPRYFQRYRAYRFVADAVLLLLII